MSQQKGNLFTARSVLRLCSKIMEVTMETLDLRRSERVKWNVILPDGKKIQITSPSKAQSDLFPVVGNAILSIFEKDVTKEELEECENILYESTAALLSRNTESRLFSKKDVEKLFSKEQAIDFLCKYTDLLSEIIKSKN